MKIAALYEKQEDIPVGFESLYTEKNGKWELTEVTGIRTEADVARVQNALAKERADHKKAKDALGSFGDLKPDEVLAKLDRIAELEELAKGKVDETKIDELVEKRIKSRIAPIEREKQTLTQKVTELTGEVEKFRIGQTRQTIQESVRQAAVKAKLLPEAVEDALVLAERVFVLDETGRVQVKDDSGFTAGVEPEVWFTEIQSKRPHWWGTSQGAGSRPGGGGTGPNPFSREHWNLTEQGKLVRTDRAKAEQLAKAAGTTIGGKVPPAKK